MHAANMGSEGFKWFIGLVVDVDSDPLQLGRVKVKIFQEHDNSNIEDEDLLWAQLMMPVTSSSTKHIGHSPTGMQVGDHCMGFYMDVTSKQYPVVMGTWHMMPDLDPNKSDVTPLATGKQVLTKTRVGPEPDSAYKAKYPHNKVYYTKSGHAIEIDDTPGEERLHVFHKSGSYVEINMKGRMVTKVVDDDYQVVTGNRTVYVKGDIDISSDSNINITAKGNVKIRGKRIDFN